MRAFVKIVGFVGAVTLIVIVGAGSYLAFFFDANRYKPHIVAAVREATGREIQMEGDLSITLFPQPQGRLGSARLLNAADFGAGALAELDSASATVRLLPLLQRQIAIREVVIEGLRVELVKNRRGETNWSNLLPIKSGDASGGNWRVLVQSLRLREAEILLKDEFRKREFGVSSIELNTGSLGGPGPVPVEAKAKLKNPILEGTASLTGKVLVDRANGNYAARQIDISFSGSGPGLPNKITAELKGDAALDFEAQSLRTAISGRLFDLAIEAQLAAERIDSEPRFSGKLSISEFNPRSLLMSLGRSIPETRDQSALTQAGVSFGFAGNGSRFTIEPIAGRLDASMVSGKITVADYQAPRIRFHLNVDHINIDRYRPAKPKPPSLKDSAIAKLSEEILRGLNIAGDVSIGTLILAGDRTNNFRVIVEAGP